MKRLVKIVLIIISVVLVYQLIVQPVYAFMGAVKVVEEAALALAKKEAVQEAIAIAAAAGGGVATRSLALRVATAGIPWLGLGITLGLVAYDIYYSSSDLNSLNSAVAGQSGWYNPSGGGSVSSNPDNNYGYGAVVVNNQVGGTSFQICGAGNNQEYSARHVRKTAGTDETRDQFITRMGYPVGSGWEWVQCGSPGAGYVYEFYAHNSSATYNSTDPVYSDGVASQSEIENWFASNPSSGLNPDNRVSPVGVGGSSQPADDVVYMPLEVGDVTVTTKMTPDTGDIVIGDGFAPVEDTVTDSTQTTTRETTTVDGVDTIEETAQTTCAAGGHDDRSLGTVLQTHVDSWQNNGLVSSLGVLQSVVFPDTLPVIPFNSSIFGNLEIDMNDFSSWFSAVKVLLIASSVILSYRIVFGGG